MRLTLNPDTGQFEPDNSGEDFTVNNPQERLSNLGDPQGQIDALLQQIAAMSRPGYKEKHPDMAYTSRIYNDPVPNIQARPEFKSLMTLLAAQHGNLENQKLAYEGNPQRVLEQETMKRQAAIDAAHRADLMAQNTPGTPQYDRIRKIESDRSKAASTRDYATSNADTIDRALADILGVPVDQLGTRLQDQKAAEGAVAPAVGAWDARTPTFLQNATNIKSYIDNLKSKAQMFGLSNLRKSGVAPGSITEREWPKFEAMLGNIDPKLSETEFIKQLKDIFQQTKSAREGAMMDYENLSGGQPMPRVGASGGWGNPQDDAAYKWAREHQNDPRSRAILEALRR